LVENQEEFSVSLKVDSPYSVTGVSRATVSIGDASSTKTVPTEITTAMDVTTDKMEPG